MHLTYLKNILPHQDTLCPINCLAWAANGSRLATSTTDNVVLLFDSEGNHRDKFNSKPVDPKYGKSSFVITTLTFSPDSVKLAVGQSDNILFVYKLGREWSSKKVICNKFLHQSSVTSCLWPTDQKIIVGLNDGRIRVANVKNNRSSTFYNSKIPVVSLCLSPDKTLFFSSHSDGSILRVSLAQDGSPKLQEKICTHTCSAQVLLCSQTTVVAAGSDKRILVYGYDGQMQQQFDFSTDEDEWEFSAGAVCPVGHSIVAIGSHDRIRIFDRDTRKKAWNEAKIIAIKHFYCVTSIAWTFDGTCVAVASISGGVDLFRCNLRTSTISANLESTFVGPSQVQLRNFETNKSYMVCSTLGRAIKTFRLMAKESYVVAHTDRSLIVFELETGRSSEVTWKSAGNERFYFDFANACLVYNAGEMSVIEYGKNDILISVTTQRFNPHLVSVRISQQRGIAMGEIKHMAYAITLKTVRIINILNRGQVIEFSHESKIDWLELNETGKFLLFRDRKMDVHLYNVKTDEKHLLQHRCGFVQWVPSSDVVVVESQEHLYVWYNIQARERVTIIPIAGEVVQLFRADGKTNVVVKGTSGEVNYVLDENLVEYATAMEDNDYFRAVNYLETLGVNSETEPLWKQLADAAMQSQALNIAERCYAALQDYCHAKFLFDIKRMIRKSPDGINDYRVQVEIALINNDVKKAAEIYLAKGDLNEAIDLYKSLNKWEEALQLARTSGYSKMIELRDEYFRYLIDSEQFEIAAKLKEQEQDFHAAIDFYLKGNHCNKASGIIMAHNDLLNNVELVRTVAICLVKNEMYEQAGLLFEKAKDFPRALECYKKAKAYQRGIELSRSIMPENVVRLEEEWGDHLFNQRRMDSAISHYIGELTSLIQKFSESGQNLKALEAAVNACQWVRASEIAETLGDAPNAKNLYHKIASYFSSVGEHLKSEKLLLRADRPVEAVLMYVKARKWEDAERISRQYLRDEEISEIYCKEAEALEAAGKLKDAEKLYCAVSQPDNAIAMYKRTNHYEEMMALMAKYHGDSVDNAHQHLAEELEKDGQLREAEKHYVAAGNWAAAIEMYENGHSWEDALRVAKASGIADYVPQVAYRWALSLRGDSAVKILRKLDLLEAIIDHAMREDNFEFALELCRLGMKSKSADVHLKHAVKLKDGSQLADAEAEFLAAGKAKDAVLMYIEAEEWSKAESIAESHCKEMMQDLYLRQADIAAQNGDHVRAESFFLRAEKPELIISMYKDANKWADAFRICREYLPQKLQALQLECDEEQMNLGESGAKFVLSEAKDCEERGDYDRAVSCYLRVKSPLTENEALTKKCITKAADLVTKFANTKTDLVKQVATRLKEVGSYREAAELYLSVDQPDESVNCLVAGRYWSDARKLASNCKPALLPYVQEQYTQSLKTEGDFKVLASVDLPAAVQLLVEGNRWEKALEIMKQQNNADLLSTYLLRWIGILVGQAQFHEAFEAIVKYDLRFTAENAEMVSSFVPTLYVVDESNEELKYRNWSLLRNALLHMAKQKRSAKPGGKGGLIAETLERHLMISHYYTLRAALSALDANKDADVIRSKISAALLRHTDLLSADKAFYEAGVDCRRRDAQYQGMAFVFLNHFLDIVEAIEENSVDEIDFIDFENTDIPRNATLPMASVISKEVQEDVKEWVLTTSLDTNLQRRLVTDGRDVYEASLTDRSGRTAAACIITGYPVLGESHSLGKSTLKANADDWAAFSRVRTSTKSNKFEDVAKFIEALTKTDIQC